MTEAISDTPPAEKKKLGTYFCNRCELKIEGISKDPIHSTTLGIFHGKCMKEAYQAIRDEEAKKDAEKAAKKKPKKVKKDKDV